MLHLLIMLLMHMCGRDKPKDRMKRRGKTVIGCPMCGKLGLADEISVDVRSGQGWGASWVRVRNLLECHACRRQMNAEAFVAEDGVMQVKHWTCGKCGVKVAAIRAFCPDCGARV